MTTPKLTKRGLPRKPRGKPVAAIHAAVRSDAIRKGHKVRKAKKLLAGTGVEIDDLPSGLLPSGTGACTADATGYEDADDLEDAQILEDYFASAPPPLVPAVRPADDPPSAIQGRPAAKKRRVVYSRIAAEAICQRIAEGEPLQQICALPYMPTPGQALGWLRHHEDFRQMYEEARILQADFLADKMLGLAQAALDADPKQAQKFQVAAGILAKQAEWRAPRRFGSKVQLDIVETPKTPNEVREEIKRLQSELGVPEPRRIH